MEYPQALHRIQQKRSGSVVSHATNCARWSNRGLRSTARPCSITCSIRRSNLAPRRRHADPSGDYAFEVFRKADTLTAGARAVLESKALKLTGTATSAMPPPGLPVYGWHIAEGRADIFLCLPHRHSRSPQTISGSTDRPTARGARGRRRLRPGCDKRCASQRGTICSVHPVVCRAERFNRLRICTGTNSAKPDGEVTAPACILAAPRAVVLSGSAYIKQRLP